MRIRVSDSVHSIVLCFLYRCAEVLLHEKFWTHGETSETRVSEWPIKPSLFDILDSVVRY